MANQMDSVCRTCFGSSNLKPLFPRQDQQRSFERALFLSTGLQITVNDGLPQNICKNCAKVIESAMHFRAQSQATEKKLLKYFKHMKKKSDSSCSSDSADKYDPKPLVKVEENVQEKFDIKIEIDKMDEEVVQNDSFMELLASPDHVSSEEEDLFPKTIPDDGNYSEEEKTFKRTESSNRRRYLELIEGPLEDLDPKKPIQCKLCKKFSKSFNAFEKHAMSHLGYNILCEFCGKSCISNPSLLRHQRAKHGLARDNSFPCSFCGFQAIDKEQLEVHERRVHTKERPFVCDDCGAGFYSKRVLIQHRVNHKTDKPYQCDLCPSKFKTRSQLTNHSNRVHSKKYVKYTYGCHVCLKRYSSTSDARKHLVKIHGIPLEQQGKVHRIYLQPRDA